MGIRYRKLDYYWMRRSIELGKQAALAGEVPVGALLIADNQIIGEGWNSSISQHDATAHAEVIALRQGGQTLSNYRLINACLYVTLEPCLMCIGAMIHARIKRVVFGAFDPKIGAVNMVRQAQVNHQIDYIGGILFEECGQLLIDFFKERR